MNGWNTDSVPPRPSDRPNYPTPQPALKSREELRRELEHLQALRTRAKGNTPRARSLDRRIDRLRRKIAGTAVVQIHIDGKVMMNALEEAWAQSPATQQLVLGMLGYRNRA